MVRWSNGDYQIAPIAARSTAMGRWRLTPPWYWGDTACGRDRRRKTPHPSACGCHLPLKGKANGGVSFNAAKSSRGRLFRLRAGRGSFTPLRGYTSSGAARHLPLKGKALGSAPLEGKAWGIKRSARGRFFWLCLSLFGDAGQAGQGQERQDTVEGYAGVGGLGRTLGIVGLSIGGRVVVIAAGGGRCPHGIQRQRHF